MQEIAKIRLNNEEYDFPIITGTENEKAIDISELRKKTGFVTLDRGYENTASTESAVTFVDGEKGILRYRGYPIEQLVSKSSFLEVAYLLINEELPTEKELANFIQGIHGVNRIHKNMEQFYAAFSKNIHPMTLVSTLVSALSGFYLDAYQTNSSPELVKLTINRLLAKTPTIISWAYKHIIGGKIMYQQNELSYCDNLQYMLFATPENNYTINPYISQTLDKLLILHADHEQSCSTSTVRLVGSSQVNLYSAISAGISALWGQNHGGANQAVIEMLEMINRDGRDIKKWIDKAKDESDPFELKGVGHRVYKTVDPRVKTD